MNSGENVEVKVTYLEKLHFQKKRENLKNTYSIPALTTLKALESGHYIFKIPFPFL